MSVANAIVYTTAPSFSQTHFVVTQIVGMADYVLGSRNLWIRDRQPTLRLIGNLVFTGLSCLASGRRISDGQTAFLAISRRALECAEITHDYNYAQVLTLDRLKKRMRKREVLGSYRIRTKGKPFISVRYLWRMPVGILREMLRKLRRNKDREDWTVH